MGVTQTLAAAVLRSTQGKVKFNIGREKAENNPEGHVSEITRLIQQSLEQDRLKDEYMARQAQLIKSPQSPLVTPTTPPPIVPLVPKRTIMHNNDDDDDEDNDEDQTDSMNNLKSRLIDYEHQNAKLKNEIDHMKTQCVNFTVKECEQTNELKSLKEKLNQMMEQYAELNEKYNQNSDKIKFFEQRDQEQNEAIEKLKKELLNINSKNGQSIEIFKSPLRNPNFMNQNRQEHEIIINRDDQSPNTFGIINRATPILDNEPSKFKSSLIKRGSLATRHLPHQTNHIDEQEEKSDDEDDKNKIETDDDAIYKLRILNNSSNYIYDNNTTQIPIQTDLMSCSSNSTVTNSVLMACSTTTTSTSFASTSYGNQSNIVNFSQPIEEWSCESVAQWLAINDLAIYIDSFMDKMINGEKLLSIDSAKLKVI